MNDIKLTQFSPGGGCGCKISPAILEKIIKKTDQNQIKAWTNLLVGNESRDDAAVYDLGNGTSVISTTDFFMPITDNAIDFGKIASVNAISDVYAMGGKPLMAIAILGWPLSKISEEIASLVIDGSRMVCNEAGIPLAGGHSIESLEPIFGLAVTGIVETENIKKNNTANKNCDIYLTKPIGVGVMSSAMKMGLLKEQHYNLILKSMTTLNSIGEKLGSCDFVKAMTDVTGFGLLGHMQEMCEGNEVNAVIQTKKVPIIDGVLEYIEKSCIPGGTKRNWKSYGHHIDIIDDLQKNLFCDPQTSGGLLIAVDRNFKNEFENMLIENNVPIHKIGYFTDKLVEKNTCISFE